MFVWKTLPVAALICCGSVSAVYCQPLLPVVPKSLHAEYSKTWIWKAIPPDARDALIEKIEETRPPHADESIAAIKARTEDQVMWTISADYWIASPKSAKWTTQGKYETSIITDGRLWAYFGLPQTGPTMAVYPPNKQDFAKTQDSTLGVITEGIPYLGYAQPGKTYRGQGTSLRKTSKGWEEICKIPHPYAVLSNGKPYMMDARLTYDRIGRLVKFEKELKSPGVYSEIWDYSDFVKISERLYVPRTAALSERFSDMPGHPEAIDRVTVYKIKSLDLRPLPIDFFSTQYPPQNTYIQDYRFHAPGLSDCVLYHYKGQQKLDEQSLAQFTRDKDQSEQAKNEPKVVPALEPIVGQPFDFELTDISGKKVRLADYKEKTVIIDVWATWCGPCIREIPLLQTFQREVEKSGQPVQFIGVSIDTDRTALMNYLKDHPSNYPIILLDSKTRGILGRVESIPRKFVVNKDGVLKDIVIGSLEKEQLIKLLEK